MNGVSYRSSRDPGGGTGSAGVSFREALLAGLAGDGGLYLPDRVPSLPAAWRESGSFTAMAAAVLEPWLQEPAGSELRELVAEAIDFPVPLVPLSRERYVVELFHGPTLSFKDFGARTMARLMDRYLAGSGRTLTILVATSGDTGSAVADGFAGLENLRVVLLYPMDKVSDVQERQLTAARPGLLSLRVRGSFDDCQRMVKAAFVDPLLAGVPLSSANSINIGRLLPQQLYYLWAVAELERLRPTGDAPVISVPSGNLGNLTAGLLAAAGGLPVARFLAAHNANDYFPRFLGGTVAPFAFRETAATLSNAMDVGAPSNFERLHALFGAELSDLVWGAGVDDQTTMRRMEATFIDDGYIACPHTAVGLEAVDRYRAASGDDAPALILATAHPAKFPVVVQSALGRPAPVSPRLEALRGRPSHVDEIEADPGVLRELLLTAA
ncbi:MAG: threonine synthase [Trueperaceae bacterium]